MYRGLLTIERREMDLTISRRGTRRAFVVEEQSSNKWKRGGREGVGGGGGGGGGRGGVNWASARIW